MGENLRSLYDLMDYTNHNDLPGLLLLIDFEKKPLIQFLGNSCLKFWIFITSETPSEIL